MNILVTGSSGFIARFLVPGLSRKGCKVVGIDKRPGPAFGDYFRFVHGNILDPVAVEDAMRGADAVIHLAAEHKDFGVSDKLFYEVNVDGTELLLQAAASLGVRKFVFLSSVAVYGSQPVPTEETLPPAPESVYGKSKLLAEHRLEAWARQSADRSAVIIRPTVVFGPYNYQNMYRLIHSIARGRYIGVGDGSNIKSVGYVENVAAATMHLLDRMTPGVEVFNYADAPHMSTHDLVSSIAKGLGTALPALRIPKSLAMACARPFDLLARLTGADLPLTAKRIDKFTSPTHHKAEKILQAGFQPPCALEEGIRRTVTWYSADLAAPQEAGALGAP